MWFFLAEDFSSEENDFESIDGEESESNDKSDLSVEFNKDWIETEENDELTKEDSGITFKEILFKEW